MLNTVTCRLPFILTSVVICLLGQGVAPKLSGKENSFQDAVAPILQRRCLSCHNDDERKGDFSLQTATSSFDAGYIAKGDADASYLVELITPEAGHARMPKDADSLSPKEIAAIRAWIQAGAHWPEGLVLSEPEVADLDWWSLRPLQLPAVPEFSTQDSTKDSTKDSADDAPQADVGRLAIRTPIDAFVQAKLTDMGLVASPEADRRTLIRRVYFDLIGLPPTPEAIDAYVHDDQPLAYERMVDRLLASKHYGERWARHWLDVVHYADTHGYDKDKPRPNAWPYRDYVIRSFNQDKPYARFVQEQIAGDVLWPDTVDGITATGFIAAGPWDFIGHAEVPETKIDGKIARYLDRDDMVSSTLNTFCSMTVQCARCHNHKFDPVTQKHYYSLQAVFAALDRADRPYDRDPEIASRRVELAERQERLDTEKQELDFLVRQLAGERLAELDEQLDELKRQHDSLARSKPEFGYHSQIEAAADRVKWVQVDLGQSTPIARLVFVACHDDFNGIGAGFGFPQRYRIEVSDDETFMSNVTVLLDHTQFDMPNPGTVPQKLTVAEGIEARYVRFTATKLAHRLNDYIMALAELMVYTPEGRNAAADRPVTSLDSIEAPERWQRRNLVDGYYVGGEASSDLVDRIEQRQRERRELLEQTIDDELRAKMDANQAATAENTAAIAALPAPSHVYAGTIHHGSGAFAGTGASGGKPRTIHVLHRGDVQSPREEVQPGTIPIIAESNWQFELPESHAEGDRRIALAQWIIQPDNPLTWRSIVNRIWLYHFGRALADSPNDLGRMGKQPTHPELLDWLAVNFRDGGQSFKELHRLIVTSSVYRQQSSHHEANAEIDSDNLYLWRMNRRRLSAEELRDAVLAVSGKLDRTMYGPGFQLFVIERPEHSPHYQYHKHDPDDATTHRRSIYRFIVRSQPDPFMTTLDCADSSQSVAKRDETITALQALSLLNNPFMLAMAEQFAASLESEATAAGASTIESQVAQAFRLATGRDATSQQQAMLAEYAQEFGMQNACRLMLNLNEFMFVD
jgi:hypothetical protein